MGQQITRNSAIWNHLTFIIKWNEMDKEIPVTHQY